MNTRWRAVALMVILVVLLSACGQARESDSAQSLVIRPRLVAATGEIVARSPANAEFCGGSFAASYTGQPLRCADGIKVEGVSLASLSDKTTTRGVTTGSAYLRGTVRNGVLRISRQGPPRQTPAGYDQIGVQSDVDRARTLLTAAYGQNWIRVVRDTRPAIPATFRYDDVAAWNGGDFIYHLNSTAFSDCTAGIPVHNTSTGTDYMLTASHCFWSFASNGVGTTVLNGYVESSHSVYPNSSTTLIGDVTTDSNVADGTTSLDVALIQASTSTVDFDDAWNASGRAIQVGTSTNSPGL